MTRYLALLAPLLSTACCTSMGCVGFGVIELDGELLPDEAVEFLVQVGADEGRCVGIVGEPLTCEGRLQVELDDDLFPDRLMFMSPSQQRLASVLVARDDVAVFDETFRVDVNASRLNGPLCGVTCRSFQAVVQW